MSKKLFSIGYCLLAIVIITFVSWFAISSIAQEDDEDGSFRLVVLGDSLASGYLLPKEESFIARLQTALQAQGLDNIKVISSAIAGSTTQDGVNRLQSVLDEHPHAVLLELGANDLLKGIDSATTRKNLEELITTFQQNDIPVMLIGINIPLLIDVKRRQDAAQMYTDLAKKYKLVLYPNFLQDVLIERFGTYDLKYMQSDSVHPTAEGVNVMVKKITPVIVKFLYEL